jgi:hypothetical protein
VNETNEAQTVYVKRSMTIHDAFALALRVGVREIDCDMVEGKLSDCVYLADGTKLVMYNGTLPDVPQVYREIPEHFMDDTAGMGSAFVHNECDVTTLAISSGYPKGWVFVINEDLTSCTRDEYKAILESTQGGAKIASDHPIWEKLEYVRCGCMVAYTTNNQADYDAMWETFLDYHTPRFQCTVYENGIPFHNVKRCLVKEVDGAK